MSSFAAVEAAGLDLLAEHCDAAFVVSCDHPLLRASFVSRLVALLEDHPAVVPDRDGLPYPLVAVYCRSVRGLVGEMLEAGELRGQDLVKRCGARIVPPDELRNADPELESLRNVNDRESYKSALRTLGACELGRAGP